jgi:hypothetical protein
MKRQVTSPELTALRRHWRRWTQFVALQVRHQGAQVVAAAQEYQTLHQELMAACVAVGGAAEGTTREFYQRLENLARPWLTASALAQADHEILLNLLAHCRYVEKELGLGYWGRGVRRWVLAGVALLVVATAVVLLLGWAGKWTGLPSLEGMRAHLQALAQRLQGTWWWVVAAVTALLLAIVVVWRSGRTGTEQ